MAQKVKEKDDVYSVDDKAFVKKECKNVFAAPCVFTTPDGATRLFSLVPYEYMKTMRVNEGHGWYDKEIKSYYFQIRFIPIEKDFYSMQTPKEIIREMYKSGCVNADGSLDATKVDEFIRVYAEEPPVRTVKTY